MAIQAGAQTLEASEIHKAAAATRAKVAAGGRMFFVDNLRVFLTILVVLHHLAITYGADGSWFYRERPTTELAGILLSLFLILNQFYFMGLFFLISGYFVPGAVDRKGGWRFLKDRLVRLGIPLVAYTLLVSPAIEYIKGITEGYYWGSIGQFYLGYWRSREFSPGPLWFVEVLLVFSLAYTLGRAAWDWAVPRIRKSTTPAVGRPLTQRLIVAFILVMAAATFAVRLYYPTGKEWMHMEVAFFPQYILMFAAGILAYRSRWLPDLPAKVRRVWTVVAPLAMVTLPVIMILGGATEDTAPFQGGLTLQSAFTSTYEAIYTVAMAIAMLGLFRRWLDRQAGFGKFLSQNAYSVYIIHPVVIVPLAWSLAAISLDPLLKFVLVAPLAVSLCFLAANFLLRRIPYAERVL